MEETILSGEVSSIAKDLQLQAPLHTISGSHFLLGDIELQSGSFNTEAGSTLALMGKLSGPGNFVKGGQGTLILMGADSPAFEGKTVVNCGLLALHKKQGSALSGEIVINGGTIAVVTPGQIGEKSKISLLGGTLDLQGHPIVLDTLSLKGGNLEHASEVIVNELELQGAPIAGHFKVEKIVSSDIVAVDGLLHLSGTSSHEEPTHVRSGALLLSGTLEHSPLSIHPGAFLKGSGVAADVHNEGTVQPYHLKVRGSFTQTPEGTIHFQLQDRRTYDQLIIEGGKVTLAGTALVEFLPTYSADISDKLLLIDNANGEGIIGTFDQLLVQNLPVGYNARLDYLAQGVFLLFDSSATSIIGLPGCYLSLPPILFASADERLTSYTRKMTTLRNHKQEGVQLYADGIGSLGHQKKSGNTRSLHYSSGGARVGADWTTSRAILGGAITYESTWSRRHNRCASFDFAGVYGDVYGSISPASVPELFVEADVGGGLQFYDIHRRTSGKTAKGDPKGTSFNFLVDLGYQYRGKAVYFVPSVGVEWMGAHIHHYKEHQSADNNLEINSQSARALRSNVGATLGYRFSHKEWQITPEVRGIWRHDFARQHHHVGFEVASTHAQSHFKLDGAGRELYLIGAQLMFLTTQFQLHASYDYQFSHRLHTNFFETGLGWHF